MKNLWLFDLYKITFTAIEKYQKGLQKAVSKLLKVGLRLFEEYIHFVILMTVGQWEVQRYITWHHKGSQPCDKAALSIDKTIQQAISKFQKLSLSKRG